MYRALAIGITVAAAWMLPVHAVTAADVPVPEDEPFAKIVPVLPGAPPEGFTIGKGTSAYSASIDGSIYKVDLRSGEGEVLVPAEPNFDLENDCYKLGLRVDPRTNYLFVAGCVVGNAYVFDAESGEEVAQYELATLGTVINDVATARRAVYFTDFTGPFLYELPLSRNGDVPRSTNAAKAIPLIGSDATDPLGTPQTANGIVLMADNKTLVIGDSSTAQIYRVDPKTGVSDRIILDTPLVGFIDGIVRDERRLYILTPADPEDPTDVDRIQVVKLDKDMLTGKLMGIITDEDLDGVASGAIRGNSLYVNNARYTTFPEADTEYWLTKLKIKNTTWTP